MSNIDKEWLQQKIADMEATRDEIPFGLDEDDSNTLAALRIALASLEAEIHSYTFEDDPRPLYTAPPATVDKNPLREFAMEYIESWELGMAGDSSLLASARKAIADSEILQPAPVSVPKDIPDSVFEVLCQASGGGGKACDFADELWNACRAAMLQGADGNSPVIPDGWVACSERMPKKGQEVLCTDQFENYETALYDTGYIPGPPFFATTAGEFHPTHWMPLPNPPKE